MRVTSDTFISAVTAEQPKSADGPYLNILGKQLAPWDGFFNMACLSLVEPFYLSNAALGFPQNVLPSIPRALLITNKLEASVVVLRETITEFLTDSRLTTPWHNSKSDDFEAWPRVRITWARRPTELHSVLLVECPRGSEIVPHPTAQQYGFLTEALTPKLRH